MLRVPMGQNFSPGYPQQSAYPQQPPYQQQQPKGQPPGVDVQVSYAARLGCSIAVAVVALLVGVWMLVGPMILEGSGPPQCGLFVEETPTCAGHTARDGTVYFSLSVPDPATYSITVRP